jgi:hypothetical protein
VTPELRAMVEADLTKNLPPPAQENVKPAAKPKKPRRNKARA